MAQTNAERQKAHRLRQKEKLAKLRSLEKALTRKPPSKRLVKDMRRSIAAGDWTAGMVYFLGGMMWATGDTAQQAVERLVRAGWRAGDTAFVEIQTTKARDWVSGVT